MAHYSVLPNVCNIQLTGFKEAAASWSRDPWGGVGWFPDGERSYTETTNGNNPVTEKETGLGPIINQVPLYQHHSIYLENKANTDLQNLNEQIIQFKKSIFFS